jgi:CBS domain-containing protein
LQRLEALQKEMDFTLERIDVTFKPQTLVSKGISAVPVVEVGNERLVGNATSEQLADLIALGLAQSSTPWSEISSAPVRVA